MGKIHAGPSDPAEQRRHPDAEAVTAQLARILSSRDFAQSARLQTFLRHIVRETLAGRGARLSEYAIALDVFGRDDSFDPRTSSIVRVEASRLRAKLEKYNAGDGRNDPVRIVLPRGCYVPVFESAVEPAAPVPARAKTSPRPGRRHVGSRHIALASVLFAAIAGMALLALDPAPFRPAAGTAGEAVIPDERAAIAVLPLRNLSGDPANDYFSDGMTEALITSLARGGRVDVTSVSSVLAFKDGDRPLAEIARRLGVSHVVEGSVLRVGDKVRITAKLVEVRTGRHLWAESYERAVADILALQADIANRIVASLTGHVAPAGQRPSETTPAVDPEAYEAHLRGRFFLGKMTESGFRKGIAYFRQAIRKAPDFARAHSGIAACYCLLGGHGFELVKPDDAMPAARQAVRKALELDPVSAEAYAFLGIIRLKYDWNWAGAEAAFKRSIALNPSYAQARIFYSFFHEAMGRQAAAIRQAEAARMHDPLSLAANVNLGWQYLQGGHLEKARRIFESTAELDPGFWGVHWGLGYYERLKGRYAAAIAAFRKAVDAGGGHAMPLSALGYTHALAGDTAKAREVLDRLAALGLETYVSPFNMAVVHAGLGEADAAFAWLDKAYADRSRSMAWLNVTRELDGLRSESRFAALRRRVGLPAPP